MVAMGELNTFKEYKVATVIAIQSFYGNCYLPALVTSQRNIASWEGR